MRVLACLLQRVDRMLDACADQYLERLLIRTSNGFKLPVLYFEDKNATLRMEDNEIWVAIGWADGNVVPKQIIIFQLCFKTLCKSLLTSSHSGKAGAKTGDQYCHIQPPMAPAVSTNELAGSLHQYAKRQIGHLFIQIAI